MSVWTHAICLVCWRLQHPDSEPVISSSLGPEVCCFCGQLTAAGIYVRHDPAETKCRGEHGGEG